MKILYHHRVASKDGQYVHVEGLTTAFKQAGHEIRMVCPKFADESDFGSDGGIATRLKAMLPKWFYELLELSYSLLIAVKLSWAIIRFKPDIIYERYNLYQPIGVMIAKLFGLPILQEVNAPLVAERSKYSGLSLKNFAKKIENFTWRHSTKVLPVTQVLAEHVYAAGVSRDKVVVIPNGIHESFLKELDEKSAAECNDDEIIIGFTGFIHPWHGLDIALEAMAEVNDGRVKLVCVGDGDILPDLRQQAQKLGIEGSVEFTGLVPRERIIDYVSRFDIALQPSVTEYASPLKLFEYLANGSLVIAPDMPNIREILSEENALLFDINYKREAFKESLIYALKNYDSLGHLRTAARELIDSKGLTWQQNAQKVIALAEQVTQAR